MKTLVLALVFGTVLAGCAGGFGGIGGSSGENLITFAGITGVGCGFIPEKDKADARKAVACAQAVFSETVSPEQVAACAAAGGVPSQYQVLVGLVVEKVLKASGGELLDPSSDEAKAVDEFLKTCAAALG